MNATTKEPKAVKKMENGNFAVQYKGGRKWFIISKEDRIIFEYIVYWMIKNGI